MPGLIAELLWGLFYEVLLLFGGLWVALFLKIVLQKKLPFSKLYHRATERYYIFSRVISLLFIGISFLISSHYFY